MRIALLGVGLIGGSIGLAARKRLGAEVIGFDPDPQSSERAVELGALDRSASSVADAVADADVVFCAAPVRALPGLVGDALEASGAETAVSDVGSTKEELVEEVSRRDGSQRFIGGHPLAGAETAGVESSRADLFEGARWYLTPLADSEGVMFERLNRLIGDLGARPEAIDPGEHDRMMATVSHLPHVLSNVLVSRAADTLTAGDRRPEVGRSFRDATRVAGANPGIWADIFATNSVAVAAEVEAVIAELSEALELLREGEGEAIGSWQARALESRRRLDDAKDAGGPQVELRIAVENRPGALAEIALALGKAGVNIDDMSLFPSADRRSGAISLWVIGEAEARRAAGIVTDLGHTVSIAGTG